ncbi:MAG: hypothetical protein D6E12_09965 [Desulfovibrio sp.]|nr:MAG: hypothetical protein D6E12_09965 [Desulfovibrio sp.]
MDPSLLIPTPDPIPAHSLWFEILLVTTFVLHLLLMNTVMGGAVVALFSRSRGKEPSPVAKDLSLKLPTSLALAVNFGVAPLLFLQVLYAHFFYPSSIVMAVFKLSIVFLVILAYYSLYIYDFRFDKMPGSRNMVLGFAVALLLVVGFLFTNNMTLMLKPEYWAEHFDAPGGFNLNWTEPTLFPRYLHFMVASLAVGGLFTAILGQYKAKAGDASGETQVAQGMKWFAWATLAQVAVGTWFLVALPAEFISLMMGGKWSFTVSFFASMAGALACLHFGFKNQVRRSIGAVVFTISAMAILRHLVRKAYLAPYFSLEELQVNWQPTPLFMFLAAFVLGLVLVAYILKLACRAAQEG